MMRITALPRREISEAVFLTPRALSFLSRHEHPAAGIIGRANQEVRHLAGFNGANHLVRTNGTASVLLYRVMADWSKRIPLHCFPPCFFPSIPRKRVSLPRCRINVHSNHRLEPTKGGKSYCVSSFSATCTWRTAPMALRAWTPSCATPRRNRWRSSCPWATCASPRTAAPL